MSGYSSIQQYVPYTFWHEADPRITAVLQNALKPYQHELLLPKAQGIPLLIQHGSSDDNVPVFHARRMSQLASQAQVDVEYHELAGMGHWFEGVMTTKPLLTFYDKHLRRVPGASYDTHTAASQRGQPNSTEMPGNMNGLFLTTGAFQIRYCHDEAANIALQISRNFYQYLAADSDIFATCGAVQDTPGNVITVGIGKDVSRGDDDYPITLVEDRLVVRDPTGTRTYTAGKHGLAAIFLRPLSDERVEMVVWGADLESLRVAARLVPLVTGAAQPHFVVTTRASLYKGASAALAMGFFNPDWAVADGA